MKKKKNKERKQTNQQKQCCKNYKENTGTKLISNTSNIFKKRFAFELNGDSWQYLPKDVNEGDFCAGF